ncbi:uncharacterized protein LOC120342911 [Styela clava]|uniref:uncharacterized protein LOC120342911 n=1 Tax=Styela clava TaxID=7725 RepID=UPI00193A9D0E|nr:uncharacterized protein LOC120342911 [Styela clava]
MLLYTSTRFILGFLIFIAFNFSPSQACSIWIPINPTEYSQTYITKSDSNANTSRPLGYLVSTAVFGATDLSCVVVGDTGGNGKHIEINLDIGDGTICINDRGVKNCFSDSGTLCTTTVGDSMTFSFDCKSCEGSQVTFWYRVFLEELENGETSYDENWCQTRQLDLPRSLKPAKIPVNIPTPVDYNPGGSASAIKIHVIFIVIPASVTYMFGAILQI